MSITLNKQTVAIFNKLTSSLDENNRSKKIANSDVYMPVSVEFLGEFAPDRGKFKKFSVSHYGEQNGDLMADPDVTFWVSVNCPDVVYPVTFRNDYLGQNRTYCRIDDGKILINAKAMRDLSSFCTTWFRNIKHQQGIK